MRHRRSTRRRLAALGPGSGSALVLAGAPADRIAAAPATSLPWRAAALADEHPRLVGAVVLGAAGGLAGAAGGVVAALVAVVYLALALRALRRATTERSGGAARTVALDIIGGLAADLRAGVAPASALDTARRGLAGTDTAVRRARSRLDAACEVSERLGAPLADLLDRVEADLRATERARTSVAAQTSGARASALLLASLPVAGVGLGYGMGADPLRILLHTPVGAVCLVTAMALQSAGLAWTGRLCRSTVERAS
jgi:tight adherence protein B